MDDRIQKTIEKLKSLTLDGGSHENLSAICSALYHTEYGWTCGACERLRQILIGMLEQLDPDEWADGYLAEVGIVRLPKDADGEVIHIGDELISNHSKKTFVVTRLQYSRKPACMVGGADKDDLSKYGLYAPCETRHYHKPNVPEILDELEGLRGTGDYDAVVMRAAELAGMLRELIDND